VEPRAELFGIDGDPEILSIAKGKANRENLDIQFEYGMAYELPYANASFDRLVSTLVFHHLATADKKRAFSEIYRVLRADGKMIIADLGPPQGFFAKLLSPLMRKHARVADNLNGLLPVWAKEAGFSRIDDLTLFNSVMGTIRIFRASKT
jgi:ubiquinone/menaquinone biosynthesis C-methylase UbiE